MLKAFLGYVVSVVVLLSSAYVTPTYAASASIVIANIQAGGVGAATQEFIALYNTTATKIDVSNWCLTNKNSVTFACFTTDVGQTRFLPAYGYAIIASTSFAAAFPSTQFSLVYTPISQSSGSITGGSDAISLVNSSGVVDVHSWTTSIAGGMQFERRKVGVEPTIYAGTDTAADWSITTVTSFAPDETETILTVIDVCLNIDGDQGVVPEGMEFDAVGDCHERVILPLFVTELLPNAIGADTGNEFIEIYNPNDEPVELSAYKLYVGTNLEGTYDFPIGVLLPSQSYRSFTNSEIAFTLVNSSGKVALKTQDGRAVFETPMYSDLEEGVSWAFIGEAWEYTYAPTPGSENVLELNPIEDMPLLQACAANQYRSLETNRCRLIATSNVTPCKDGQYRSEETNRCRNIAADAKTVTPCDADEERNAVTNRCRKVAAVSTPAPCKEGQERNPDTNRCRAITKMPDAGYKAVGGKIENTGSWYVWAAIGVLLILAIGYAVWEWRHEIGKFLAQFKVQVLKFARLNK